MRSNSYKIIFVLLSLSLLIVLLLQAFWIKNFYAQKQDEFDSVVYATLSNISTKLNERENLDYIKNSNLVISNITDVIKKENKSIVKKKPASIQTQTKITSNGKQMKVMVSNSSASVQINGMNIFEEMDIDSSSDHEKIMIVDSSDGTNHFQQTIVIDNKSRKSAPKNEDLNRLMSKMLMEIQTIDVSPIEDIKEDSLKRLIQNELQAKGVFIPFDFLLKKENKSTDKIIAKSKGYSDLTKSYKFDLSNNRVFRDSNFLYLQFEDVSGFVFSGMKNILIAAFLFSVIILVVFYFTMRAILRQRKVSEVKNDFINNMTHELKTPIATISLAIDALRNPQVKNDEDRFNTYTSILMEENIKLNSNVERVLQMAMLERGELQLDKSTVELNEMIQSVIDGHQLQIAKQNARIEFYPAEIEVRLHLDNYHFTSVFNNLLDNALKYSSRDCLVEIRIIREVSVVVISIKDNGIGISPANQKKIFEKFYRAQGGNLHDVKGFGLGLSYVKSIVEKHHGSISVRSELGIGSEFIIKLPLS